MRMLPKLVLGSSSPYRKELLERLHQPFLTDSPEVDETVLPGETPENLTIRLAKAKAMAVHAKHPDAFVIVQEAHQVLGDGFSRYSKEEL